MGVGEGFMLRLQVTTATAPALHGQGVEGAMCWMRCALGWKVRKAGKTWRQALGVTRG